MWKSWWNSEWWNLSNTSCLKLSIEKENTKVVPFVSLVLCLLYRKDEDFTLNIAGVIPLSH